MKILSWNIRQGGDDLRRPRAAEPPRRLVEILDAVVAMPSKMGESFDPDVIVLTEYHSTYGDTTAHALAARGYPYTLTSTVPERINGVCISSRTPITHVSAPGAEGVSASRCLHVGVDAFNLTVMGIYAPTSGNKEYRTFWPQLVNAARGYTKDRVLLLGDLNAGIPDRDWVGPNAYASEYMAELYAMGWIDAWWRSNPSADPHTYEYPYYNHRTGGAKVGFRVDHALVAPALDDEAINCWYEHSVRQPQELSDHSALLLELPT